MNQHPRSVLIVEDEQMLQDVYTLVLRTKGFDVTAVSNGRDALDQLSHKIFDIVLLDVHMPVMDGLQFMKTNPTKLYPSTKIIVYSNMSDSAVEQEMLDLGADRFVLKSSLSPAELVTMIENA